MATMAAFLKSPVLAIRHNLFNYNYLHQIFPCYKMAMWPLIVLQIFFLCATFRDIIDKRICLPSSILLMAFRRGHLLGFDYASLKFLPFGIDVQSTA
jgi:hypothetical protein